MPKTEAERMQDVINRDATIIGRVTNIVVDIGRGIVGKPPIWHEVREWEIRQETASARGLEDVLESEVAAARPATLSAAQVADHLAAEMTTGLAPERAAAAVLAPDELAIRMQANERTSPYIVGSWKDEAHEVENLVQAERGRDDPNLTMPTEPPPYGAVFRPDLYDFNAKGNPIHKVDRTQTATERRAGLDR
jgi:hypothetical protein